MPRDYLSDNHLSWTTLTQTRSHPGRPCPLRSPWPRRPRQRMWCKRWDARFGERVQQFVAGDVDPMLMLIHGSFRAQSGHHSVVFPSLRLTLRALFSSERACHLPPADRIAGGICFLSHACRLLSRT